MSNFQVFLTPRSLDDLKKIDQAQRVRIGQKLEFFSQAEDPLTFAVQLSGIKPKTYRFRVGKYRIFFDIKGRSIRVLNVSLRDKAYR